MTTQHSTEFRMGLTTVDAALFCIKDKELHILLNTREFAPWQGVDALPGGIVDPAIDATLESCLQRKLTSKIGCPVPYLEQVMTVGNGTRDPRGWSTSVVYFALIGEDTAAKVNTEQCHWRKVDDIGKSDLAFDHYALFCAALDRLKNKVSYTALPLYLMPEEFTLTELQRVFEVLLRRSLEKKSFRRRLEAADLLEDTGRLSTAKGRPAAFYRVKDRDFANFYFDRALVV